MNLEQYLTSSTEVQNQLKLAYVEELKSKINRLKADMEKTQLLVNDLEGKPREEQPNVEG